MKKLNKVLFTIIAGLFVAGVASASLGEYWSTVSHIIPRTDSTVDIGSNDKKVRAVWTDAFYGDYWISGTGNSMNIQPTGDVDDFFSFKTPADRPTIKREGGKYIYVESSNVNDVGISFRKDADHSGTVNYYKDTNEFGLTSKDPLVFKVSEDYDDYIKIVTAVGVPEMSTVGAADFKINAGGANNLLLNHAGGNVAVGATSTGYILGLGTGDTFGIGTTQWNSADKIDGTKIKDADYGDVVIDAAGDWQVSEGEIDHGALAGLADDDHTIYTLADGTRAFTGTQTFNENIEMKDDKNLYFDTAKTKSFGYSTDHAEVLFNGENLVTPGNLWLYSNTGADGTGSWEPFIEIQQGVITLENTTEGYAGAKYLLAKFTDGMRLDTGGEEAILLADNIATSNKTFQFPNASGTFIIGEGVGAGQTLIGGTTTTADLTLQTTSGVGTSGADMHFLTGNAGGTEAMTILNSGYVGIGTTSPDTPLSVVGSVFPVGKFERTTAVTNSTQGALGMKVTTSGNMSDGFGPSFSYFIEDDLGVQNAIASISAVRDGADNTGAIAFKPYLAGSATNVMRIKANGNVGIGTTAPDTNLHINDASATTDLYIESGGAGLGGRIIMEDTDGAGCTALTTLNGVLTAAIIACP